MIEVLIFRVDQFSFWVGFVAGLLFAWLLTQARKGFPTFLQIVKRQIEAARESLTIGTENRMRQDILQWAQKQHLAAPLFSLNEIVIPPRLMNPPNFVQPEDELAQDIVAQTIPYMPDYPELAAHYGGVTMKLHEALQKGANLIVIGQPGSGKTVALAHLASQMALREAALGELAQLFPLLIPAPALLSRLNAKEPLDAMIQTMTGCYASAIAAPRMKSVLKYLLHSGRVLLLLDGLDELPPAAIEDIKKYLLLIRQIYPKLRMVIAASLGDFNRLQELQLFPLAMAAWSNQDKKAFVEQWRQCWNQFISPDELSSQPFIDTFLLARWLSRKEVANSPFEITLKTWAVFAGDLLGPEPPDLIYAHLRRLSTEYLNAFPALEALATAMIDRTSPILTQREAENAIQQNLKSRPAPPPPPEPEAAASLPAPSRARESQARAGTPAQLLTSFINAGILVSYGGGQIGFAHPFYLGYLAGRAIARADHQERIENQPEWSGWLVTLGFLGYFGNIETVVGAMLEKSRQTPIHRHAFQAARWLRLAPKEATWRLALMRYLIDVLQKDYETLSSAGRALAALLLANEPGLPQLLRQLTKSSHPYIRQLAALGLGLVGDDKMTEPLAVLIDDASPGVMRAACLGLVALGTKNSLDAVISTLLNHTEEARRAAAEALVNHPDEGIEILKEGLTMDDLLVRRAVIYGMVRARRPELQSLLEKTAIEDAQWVVRNAAGQALELLKTSNLNIPTPPTPLFNQPWLIQFAAKLGVGVGAGDSEQAAGLVLQALERGEPQERLYALEHLRLNARVEAISTLYHTFYASQDELREACFDALWHMSASGLELPSPVQFGLGLL